jgi:hypothetical protein
MAFGGYDRVAELYGELASLSVHERTRLSELERGVGALYDNEADEQPRGDRSVIVTEERRRIDRLKNFFGRKPLPNNEVDYCTWRLLVMQHLNDPSVRNQELKAAMIQSLGGQALDMVQPYIINAKASADMMFVFLEEVYGDRKDGRELLISFFSELQGSNQLASEYLQGLYVKLTEVAYRGGIDTREFDVHINEQFFRGCYNESLLQRLMTDRGYSECNFTELIGRIRKEEVRIIDRSKRFASISNSPVTGNTPAKEKAQLNQSEVSSTQIKDSRQTRCHSSITSQQVGQQNAGIRSSSQ